LDQRRGYWHGKQLDEVAAPILLAWRLQQANALGLSNPWKLVSRAARYLILHGPVTGQERWEENSGYSPSTIGSIIAALVCAADFARKGNGKPMEQLASFMLDYADWLSTHVEDWTVTNRGELVPGKPRHYVRIKPGGSGRSRMAMPTPDTSMIEIANGGGAHPTRNVVSTEFLDLVRLGVRDANDPVIRDSTAVIDQGAQIRVAPGALLGRYNHDGLWPEG